MNYISLTFAVFVLLSAAIYYLIPRKLRGLVLLLGSLVFYGYFDVTYIPFLLFTALTTFLGARLLQNSHRKKLIVIISVALNASVWFFLKVLPWALHTLNRGLSLVGMSFTEPVFSLIIPVGISYYSLQAIGYLLDVARGKFPAEKHFWKYLLFLSWFPAIVQGPISRYDQLTPQLTEGKKFSYEHMRSGLVHVLFGLVKKIVIADRLALLTRYCFSNYSQLGGVILYLGAIGYAFQLYADFSGCVDICRGVSKLFRVDLTENFNRPYLATSVKEFWGKWHISLSSWLKDYIYIPLGGNRKGKMRKYLNLGITFLVSGLWHGAGLNYIFWGMLHAVYQIAGDITFALRQKFKRWIGVTPGSFSERTYQRVITFHLVLLAWIFFNANGLSQGFGYIRQMLFHWNIWDLFNGKLYTCGISERFFPILVAHLCILFAIEYKFPKKDDAVQGLLRSHILIRWSVYLLLIFDVLLLGAYGSGFDMNGFLYGGF